MRLHPAGKLARLPLELILEVRLSFLSAMQLLTISAQILSDLEPPELLQFSRLCKHFHVVLHSSTNLWVWRISLNKIYSIPPCPTDMTEVQFAALLFSEECYVGD